MAESGTVFDDRLTIETPEAVAFDLELAGIGSRGVAMVVDQLILALVIAAEVALLVGAVWMLTSTRLSEVIGDDVVVYGALAVGFLAWFTTVYGYHVFYEVRRNGRTPGKRVAGIRVAREDGGRVTFGASAIRNLLRAVDSLPGGYLVGILTVLFSRQRQRVGDMAAGTVVIYEPKERPLELGDTLLSEKTELAYDFLKRRSALSPEARDMVAREVLLALGEEAHRAWDEPSVSGRIADIIGAREALSGSAAPSQQPMAASPTTATQPPVPAPPEPPVMPEVDARSADAFFDEVD